MEVRNLKEKKKTMVNKNVNENIIFDSTEIRTEKLATVPLEPPTTFIDLGDTTTKIEC